MKKAILIFLIFTLLTFLSFVGCKMETTPEVALTMTPVPTSELTSSQEPSGEESPLKMWIEPYMVNFNPHLSGCSTFGGGWKYKLTISYDGDTLFFVNDMKLYEDKMGNGNFVLLQTYNPGSPLIKDIIGNTIAPGKKIGVFMQACLNDIPAVRLKFVLEGVTEDQTHLKAEAIVVFEVPNN